jgi:hypothetical protein
MDKATRDLWEKYGINPEEREREILSEFNSEVLATELAYKLKLERRFEKGLSENFDSIKHYINGRYRQPVIFVGLRPKIEEAISCLIMNADTAGITITNLILERLLKVALITDMVGLDRMKVHQWNEAYSKAHAKFASKVMGETIPMCRKRGLVTLEEEIELNEYREMIRNGFSHFDVDQILKEKEDMVTMFHSKFSNPDDITPVDLNIKTIPSLQDYHVADFAKTYSHVYFDYVHELIIKIERRLQEKYHKRLEYEQNIKKHRNQ